MKKTLITLGLMFALAITINVSGQAFAPAFDTFSHKEIAQLFLEDGTKVEGTIDDIDRKKGLIEEITIKGEDKKKTVYKPEQIKYMYLPPSGWAKMATGAQTFYNVNRWQKQELNKEFLDKGYAYYQKSTVMIKKTEKVLLLQVVNPGFMGKITIYHDPWATETASIGFGPMTVAGGRDKSYYIKIGDNIAYKIQKKDYEDDFKTIYEGCPEMLEQDIKWRDIDKHVFEYNKGCGSK
jgi:hypothetical protein